MPSLFGNGAPQSRNSIASHLPSGTVHGSDTTLGNTSGRGDQSGCGKREMDSKGILRELSWMSIFLMIILCEFTLGKLINEERLKHQEITTSCLLQEEHVYKTRETTDTRSIGMSLGQSVSLVLRLTEERVFLVNGTQKGNWDRFVTALSITIVDRSMMKYSGQC